MQNTGMHTVCSFVLFGNLESSLRCIFLLIPWRFSPPLSPFLTWNLHNFMNARHRLATNWIFPEVDFVKIITSPQTHSQKKYEPLFFFICRRATSQSTMTCKNMSANLPLWYIYNCTMSSSYIVRAVFLLIKLNMFRPTPHPHLKAHRPESLRSVTVTVHHSKKKGRCVYGQGPMRLFTPLRNGPISCWKSNKVLTEIHYLEWRNDTAFLCNSQQLKCLILSYEPTLFTS